jgi:tetratricopeptide (TPR) repeat protein
MTVTAVLPKVASYDDELATTTTDIAHLESVVQRHQGSDAATHVRLAYCRFHRASLTCNPADFEAAEAAIQEAVRALGAREDLCLLQATLDLRFHRLAAAKTALDEPPRLSSRREGRVILADIDFQEGRYEQSRAALERLIEKNRTWDVLARLAHWNATMGHADEAEAQFLEAEDGLTAKEMRAYAWLELQRGELRIARGDFERARFHYRRAEAAYPGHWHTDEHVAELLLVEGRLADAAALLRDVLSKVGKPELRQTLGEVLLLSGEPDEAQLLLEAALAAFLESVSRGGVHYYHHLVDFYTRARPDATEALKWARRDIQLRSNFSTQTALADALRRNGNIAEALLYIREALSSGVAEWHVFATAAEVYATAGLALESDRYTRAAVQLNPRGRRLPIHH